MVAKRTTIQVNRMRLIWLGILLLWLSGCGGLQPYGPPEMQPLNAEQQSRVGSAVADKLIQLLGGPYQDTQLSVELNRLAAKLAPRPPLILVADRAAAELYPLPGGRVVMTRGLLSAVTSPAALDTLLRRSAGLAENAAGTISNPRHAEAVAQILAGKDSVYDPDAAAIRLARQFAEHPCGQACLDARPLRNTAAGTANLPPLPEAVRRLAPLQPGFDLLARARQYEQQDDQRRAIATYLQAATAAPDEANILGSLGLACLRAGQMQPARLHLKKAIALQPDYYRTLMGLGYLELQLGNYGMADELLAESIRLLAVAENLYLLAEAREKGGDREGAMALYRLVVNADRSGKLGKSAATRLAPSAGAQ